MHKEDSRTDLGAISIHNNVIASIASLAAMEVEGVKRVGRYFKSGLVNLIKKNIPVGDIKVEIDKNESVNIEIPLIVKYEYNIPEVANRVQENVRSTLERMTNLSIKDININVQAIEKD